MTEIERQENQVKIERNLDELSRYLDGLFRVPGTEWRFGLDSLIGLIPNVGDTLTVVPSLYILVSGVRYGVPKITLLRMAFNIGLDYVVGMVPFVGDAFDLVWKANQRNVALVQHHMNTPLHLRNKARRGDWLYVAGIAAVLVVILAGLIYGAYLVLAAIVNSL